jgi:hypothetical protein
VACRHRGLLADSPCVRRAPIMGPFVGSVRPVCTRWCARPPPPRRRAEVYGSRRRGNCLYSECRFHILHFFTRACSHLQKRKSSLEKPPSQFASHPPLDIKHSASKKQPPCVISPAASLGTPPLGQQACSRRAPRTAVCKNARAWVAGIWVACVKSVSGGGV